MIGVDVIFFSPSEKISGYYTKTRDRYDFSANLSLLSIVQSQKGGITSEHDFFSTASRPALELIQLTSRAHSEG
jgi:hypothetical protein